jgi:hypothetical protein
MYDDPISVALASPPSWNIKTKVIVSGTGLETQKEPQPFIVKDGVVYINAGLIKENTIESV